MLDAIHTVIQKLPYAGCHTVDLNLPYAGCHTVDLNREATLCWMPYS